MLSTGAARADDFPNRPVKLISDSAPGSAIDVTMRIIADGLSHTLGQQAVLINQPGGGGSIAVHAASTAAPDGYTLAMLALSDFITLPGTADNLPIPRARVELRDLSTNGIVLIGVTDKFGQFAFGEVPPGKYVAEYVSTGVRQLLAASPPHDIHVDEERSTLISMMPRGNVIGVAVSSNDAPMSNSLIQLRDTASQIVMATTRSGPNGEFRFDAVWPGTYVAELIVVSTGKIAAVTTTLNVVAGESVATLLRGPSGH